MDIRKLIEKKLKTRGELRTSELIKATGFSRTYVNRILQQLEAEGRILLVGKANRARYVVADRGAVQKAREEELTFHRILRNENLHEDVVLDQIRKETGIFVGTPDNVSRILYYAFTEMLNNAIEHSDSEKISVRMKRDANGIHFKVLDRGIGVFKNIMDRRGLRTELEAIQDLLKGKQTTAPDRHSGEGIFFTSKAADVLMIKGSNKKLIFDNNIGDVFIKDIKPIQGTEVDFWVSASTGRDLTEVFNEYAGEAFEFGKTSVTVGLYKMSTGYVSRSQARRILSGLEKFKEVILDFRDVDVVGQAFADEVFRVWVSHHPETRIEVRNASENAEFMIRHVRGR